MKQILQDLNTGKINNTTLPCSSLSNHSVLVQTTISLISSGTERMISQFARANFLQKVRQQPDKVKMVLNKIKTDGFFATMDAVKSKLDQVMPLGYSNVGHILELGKNINGWSIGDRVVSNAPHAEIITVASTLCAKVPDNVSDEAASFTVLGAIALEGIRLAQPMLGENFVVMGLGLIGLLTVQLLRANGCQVIGIDYDENRLMLARQFGAETINLSDHPNPVALALQFSKQIGMDGVIITASTQSNDPVQFAAQMSRKRGRIILVGTAGLNISRSDFYEKELSFQVSCSYGPGRYDNNYEQKGQDYPIGYVRWTAQRNFEAVLQLLANGQLNVQPLISHRFEFANAVEAYDLLTSDQPSLGILLTYPENYAELSYAKTINLDSVQREISPSKTVIGFIGAGNYASRVLLPAIVKTSSQLKTLVTQNGINCVHYGKKFGFVTASTDVDAIFKDKEITTVIITTRHNTHANLLCKAIEHGKHVFVEKPLCITQDELEQIKLTLQNYPKTLLMLGFNRRFAPHVQKIKRLLGHQPTPAVFTMTINAGAIPVNHWTRDREVGGGRVLGEACHFVDLLRYLADSPIASFAVSKGSQLEESVAIMLNFKNGSFGTINYLTNGPHALSKERLEIFSNGKWINLDNFRTMKGVGWTGFKKMNLWQQNKGHAACIEAFMRTISHGSACPIPLEEVLEVSQTMLLIDAELKSFS